MQIFTPADVLIPRQDLLDRFCVVACDQYTSQPDYWRQAAELTGGSPSALDLIVPESTLHEGGLPERIERVNRKMDRYLAQGVFDAVPDSYLYVERTLRGGGVRRGLIGKLDLTAYDFTKGSASPVRATEATVLERIPPRVAVRENAALELPHVLILIDDPSGSVLGPVRAARDALLKLYDTPLMMDSGSVAGWRVDAATGAAIGKALDALADEDAFHRRYGDKAAPLVFAVGDGNHSLASAKEHFSRLCRTHGAQQMASHPARYALVEVVNLHDPSLEFEPIHRVVFDVDRVHLEAKLRAALQTEDGGPQQFELVKNGARELVSIGAPSGTMTVATLQNFLDEYIQQFGGHCDYIHGDDVVERLSCRPDALGFLLPPIDKNELFLAVIRDGALTRKTFSMGNAWDKRFYLEARKIRAD